MDEELIGLGSISELFMSEEELKSYKDSHNGKTPSEVEKERQATIERAEEAATYANPGYESGSDMDSFADALEEQRKNKIKDDLKSQVDSIGDLNKLASLYESLMTEKELEEYKNSHHGKTPSEIEKNQQEKENALSIQEAGYESDDTVSDYIDFAQDKRRKEFKDRIKEQIDNPAHRGEKENSLEKEEVLEISEQEVQKEEQKEPTGKIDEGKTIEIKEAAEDSQQNPLYLKPYKYEQNHTFLHAADTVVGAFLKEGTIEDAFMMATLAVMALPLTMAADLTAHLVDQLKKRQEHYFNQKMEYNNKNLEKFMNGKDGEGLSRYGIAPPKSKEEYPAVLLQVLNKKVNEEIQALRDKGVPEESISNRKIRKEAMADMFGEVFNRLPEELTAKEVKDLKKSLKDIGKYCSPNKEQKNTADNLKEQNKAYGDAKRSYDADTNRIRRARAGKKIMHQYNRNLNRGNEGNVA